MKNKPLEQAGPTHLARGSYTFFLPYLYLGLAILLWEGNLIAGRAFHEVISPLNMAFFRWLMASVIITLVAFPTISSQWSVMIKNWRELLVLGMTGMATSSFLIYKALQRTTAINVAILNTLIPVLILLISWAFYKREISTRQITGIFISLLGAITIITKGELVELTSLHLNFGNLWVLAALPVWAIYTILLQEVPEELHPVSTLAGAIYAGALLLLPFQLYEEIQSHEVHFTLNNFLGMLYIGGLASVGAFFCWNKGVAGIGANRAGVFLYLMPVIATILSTSIGRSIPHFSRSGYDLGPVGGFAGQ